MCLMCMKDNIFEGRNPTSLERARKRALKIKQLLLDVDNEELCYVGDAAVELLKKEQYDLAREL